MNGLKLSLIKLGDLAGLSDGAIGIQASLFQLVQCGAPGPLNRSSQRLLQSTPLRLCLALCPPGLMPCKFFTTILPALTEVLGVPLTCKL
jgi:hypothetical protein